MLELATMSTDVFGTSKSTRPRILTTDHPMLKDLTDFPPVADLPAGRVRIRLRAGEMAPVAHVRNAAGIRAFLVNVEDGKLSRGPELAANYRFENAPPRLRSGACDTMEEAAAIAQHNADRSCDKWVWYTDHDGHPKVEPAKVLHYVQLNDVVLEGEIVVTERADRPTLHLAYPGGPRQEGAIAIGFDKSDVSDKVDP